MNVELQTGLEAGKLLLRNPGKYANGVKGLYLLSFVDCELGQAARNSYFVLRNIDDSLDGERKGFVDPLSHALNVQNQIRSGNFGDQSLDRMASRAIDLLEKRSRPGDNPRKDFSDAIDIMMFDFSRSQERRVLTGQDLEQYYVRTFHPVVNLMLIGLQSQYRADDLPELTCSQGRVYTVRDIKDDWPRGTINIPAEVLEKAGLSPNHQLNDVQSSEVIREWFNYELRRSHQDLKKLQDRLTGSPEWLTVKMCSGLINPMLRFIDKFQGDGNQTLI